VLKNIGLDEVMICSPSSKNGYGELEGVGNAFLVSCWMAMVSADILRKMLLKIRPYERVPGATDQVYYDALAWMESVLEQPLPFSRRLKLLKEQLVRARDTFRGIDAEYRQDKPLLAIVGEIFCRHNRFANEDMIRKLEAHGAETWIADVSEWVAYTDWSRMDTMARQGRKYSLAMIQAVLKKRVMKHYEHQLLALFHDDFKGYEEPHDTSVVVEHGAPYLPAQKALGEMAMSIGRSGYLYTRGCDGIVDISPFSCMNGIATEAIYPSFSRDHENIPCRVFYYDGVNADLDRDISIFMELVRGYMRRKTRQRRYPDCFR
jgi:predicted nucleotide-binding protein (sugar kinase/HSP70/actin superfamily)